MDECLLSSRALDTPNPPGREKEICEIEQKIRNQGDVILLGTRRVGKTTLIKAIEKRELEHNIIRYDCMDDGNITSLFANLFARSKCLKVFVSSVGKKGKEELGREREIAEEVIKKCDCEPFLIENIMNSDSPMEVEEKNIVDSDAFLLILGNTYRENVGEEYKFALDYKIPILCMIKGEKDDRRDKGVRGIIKQIQQQKTVVYKRYGTGKKDETIKEFRKILKNTMEKKRGKWREKTINKCKKSDWRDIADRFFESVETQNNRFLFLIDEFGELRKDKSTDFEDLLSYLKSKIDEKPTNISFVVTGSENVFNLYDPKYFAAFDISRIRPFKKKIAIDVLRAILNDRDLDDKLLNKAIEICGTLPADIQLFASKIKGVEEISEEAAIEIAKELMRDRHYKIRDLFFEHLDKESKKFLKEVIVDLPASKEEMRLLCSSRNFDEILGKISEHYFIFEEKGGVYYPVSDLLKWAIIYENDIDRFNDLITKI